MLSKTINCTLRSKRPKKSLAPKNCLWLCACSKAMKKQLSANWNIANNSEISFIYSVSHTLLMEGRCFFSSIVHFWPISIRRCHRLSGHFDVKGSRRPSSLFLSVQLLTYSTCNIRLSVKYCNNSPSSSLNRGRGHQSYYRWTGGPSNWRLLQLQLEDRYYTMCQQLRKLVCNTQSYHTINQSINQSINQWIYIVQEAQCF